jgi:hypothetical protein
MVHVNNTVLPLTVSQRFDTELPNELGNSTQAITNGSSSEKPRMTGESSSSVI